MLGTPATPNLLDYVNFLYTVVGIPRVFLPSASGTTTAGDVNVLTDTSQAWTSGQWDGYTVLDITQGESALVVSTDFSSVTFTPDVVSAVVAGDLYLIERGFISLTLDIAREIVNDAISQASARLYTLAVYNLATDRLINYANDVPNQTWFQDKRKQFRLTEISVGVPSQASSDGVATGILNPEQMKLFTMQDLETLKTEWGRTYMGIAQKYGQNIWGIS